MQSDIEILEELFLESKKESTSLRNFFDKLWEIGISLPRLERQNLITRVSEYVNSSPLNQKENLALTQLAFGLIAFYEGNYEKSLLDTAKANKMFADLEDENGRQAAGVLTGCNYRTIGELELSLKALRTSFDHLSTVSDYRMFYLFCVYNLAEIYSETEQFDEALKLYEIAKKSCLEAGSQSVLARVLNGIGVTYQNQKKYDLALEYLTKSLELTEEINNLPVMARALTDLGEYHFCMQDFTKSTEFQNKALKIRKELKIPNGIVTNLILLAEISTEKENYDEAIEFLSEALEIVERIKVKVKEYQIHEKLSNIYLTKNNLEKSIFHYKNFHRIREEVLYEDNQKKIKNLELIFEAEQTKKENTIIKAQKAEIESKNTELQETIDELTKTKISRKAISLTLLVAIILFLISESLIEPVIEKYSESIIFSLLTKLALTLLLKPVEGIIERILLRRVADRRKVNLV